ncbi:MAG: tetratricopeptide repeat protein [Muribaculaceae bacterium]|nr:tetratricopeptide repeat protein [Muribaculaceae bacterium]
MANHKKIIFIIALFLSIAFEGFSLDLPAGNKANSFLGVTVENIYRLDNGKLAVELALDLNRVNMKSQFEQVFTPFLYNGTDTTRFDSFCVIGHKRLISNERNRRMMPVTFYKKELLPSQFSHPNIEVARTSGIGTYHMLLLTNWRDWMETATFSIESEVRGCASCVKDIARVDEDLPLAQTDFVKRSFFPEFLYVTPVAEAVKMREISARAYIDFPVNQIIIYPDYRRNPSELAKIRATIDSVRNDKDIKITSLHISGTASPEGGYQNNVRLARGRTEALKDYVQGLYRFPAGFITTSFEPVDWQGLSEFLQMVNGLRTNPSDSIRFDQFQNINYNPHTIGVILPNATEILGIVHSGIEPFARNQKIKTTYPSQYAWLLENVYPALRHSDYRIQFEIKTFTEVSEILGVMSTQPQKLSLAELFVAANSQEPGSEIYNKAFELAVTMYPDDETANLNAATAAMQRGDLIAAQRYLSKVNQETPEADYAKAMLMLIQGQEDEALQLFNSLANSNSPEVAEKATRARDGINDVRKANARNFIPVN